MFDVAASRDQLPADARLVRVLSLHGFGSRHAGEAAAIDTSGSVLTGGLLAGLVDDALAAAPEVGTLEVDVSDPDADAAGMACGGRALLYVQPFGSIDELAWRAVDDRVPVVLTTQLATGRTRVLSDLGQGAGSLGHDEPDADRDADARSAAILRSGRSVHEVDGDRLVESFIPPTTVRVVGRAGVGEALAAQAELLGWEHDTLDTADQAVAGAEAQRSHDALVVLSHDEAIDTPCLAAALGHGRGYVGALGSRDTQAARRRRLTDLGIGADAIAAVHGPVGLDLGSRTPAETAVAIVAEIIAHRSGRSAASLTGTDGPING